jgi:hypothetical protein
MVAVSTRDDDRDERYAVKENFLAAVIFDGLLHGRVGGVRYGNTLEAGAAFDGLD